MQLIILVFKLDVHKIYTRIFLMNDDGSLYNFIININSKEIDFVNQLGKKQSFIYIDCYYEYFVRRS